MATRSIGSGLGSVGPGTVSTVSTISVVGVLTTFTTTFTLPATILINSVLYDIATITNDTHLTTVQTQGTNTGVAYTVGLRQYSSISQWAAKVNTLTLSAAEIGECYNDAEFSETTTVTVGGWSGGSSSNTMTLKCHPGQSFRDNASVQTNVLNYVQANGVAIKNSVGGNNFVFSTLNTIIDGLQFKGTAASSSQLAVISPTSSNFTAQNCIINSAASSGAYAFSGGSSAAGLTLQNMAIISTSTQGGGIHLKATATCYDLSIVNSSGSGSARIGFLATYSNNPFTIENVAVAGFTTDYSGTCLTSSNNATDKGSFGGTGWGTSGQVSIVGATEWQSVTNGSEDLRLNTTSVKLKDNGATVGPTNDIAGTTRPQGSAYDIGCWELVAASGFKPFWAANSNVVNPRAVAS